MRQDLCTFFRLMSGVLGQHGYSFRAIGRNYLFCSKRVIARVYLNEEDGLVVEINAKHYALSKHELILSEYNMRVIKGMYSCIEADADNINKLALDVSHMLNVYNG